MQKLYDIITEQDSFTGSVNPDDMSGGNEIGSDTSTTPDSTPDEVKSILKTISDSIDRLGQVSPDFAQSDSVKKVMSDMMSLCQMQMSDNGSEEVSPEDQYDIHQDQNHGVEDSSIKMFESKQILMNQFKRFL